MSKPSKKLTAREFVWEHRLRQRIALERIILTVGSPQEKFRAKQFLEEMAKANPKLLENIDPNNPELREEVDQQTPELFDKSEYSKAKGRKSALKFPKDILWEEKAIRRAVREYRELFHPCELTFKNAMMGLQYFQSLHAELFARARAQAVEQRDLILTIELYCKCDCTTKENRQPAEVFEITNRGRFEKVSKRVAVAKQALGSRDDRSQGDWQFFLDRVREVAPEMLER